MATTVLSVSPCVCVVLCVVCLCDVCRCVCVCVPILPMQEASVSRSTSAARAGRHGDCVSPPASVDESGAVTDVNPRGLVGKKRTGESRKLGIGIIDRIKTFSFISMKRRKGPLS